VIIRVDDKIQSIKHCQLCQLLQLQYMKVVKLCGCVYSLDCLIGVIPMLVFPVCAYDENVGLLVIEVHLPIHGQYVP